MLGNITVRVEEGQLGNELCVCGGRRRRRRRRSGLSVRKERNKERIYKNCSIVSESHFESYQYLYTKYSHSILKFN